MCEPQAQYQHRNYNKPTHHHRFGDPQTAYFKQIDEVEGVDGLGLMIGVRLKIKKAADVLNKCFENGLLILTAKDKLRFLPPLNISYEQIDKGLAILKKVLDEK